MLTPFLATLVLLTQAPASPAEPITVLIAPADSAGVAAHVVSFAQEHVAEQVRAKGLTVVRMKDVTRKLPAARRRALLRCKRTELKCLTALGEAARSEVVLVAELLQRMDGHRVGTKAYMTQDGALVAEHLISGVSEQGMLDALTQSLEVVLPKVRANLRPAEARVEEPPPLPVPAPPPVPPAPELHPVVKVPEVLSPELKPEGGGPAPGASVRRWAWVPVASGAAFAGAGTYFLLQARERYSRLNEGGGTDSPLDGQALQREGRQAQNLSRVAFGLGAAGLVTGTVLYLLPARQAPVRPSVSVGPGGGLVGVAGTLP